MSSTGWTMCPDCNTPNPDSIHDPESEWYGQLSINLEWHCDKCDWELRFHCANCGWNHKFTQKDFPHGNANLPRLQQRII
jgi:RNase P subunit RPR2